MKRDINIRELKKAIEKMKSGERIYINAIGISLNAVEYLKKCVKENILSPDEEEAKIVYKNVRAIMTGETIFPQMTYIKQ